jgi:two-component system response regulator HydG
MEGRILVIDDVQDDCDLLSMMLGREGAEVVTTTSVSDALERLGREDFDVVLTDLGMQEIGGLEVCQRVNGINPHLPVVVVTGAGSMDTAIAAMRAGAYDFITKPIDSALLSISIARALQHRRVHAEVVRLRDAMKATNAPDGIIGTSRAMQRVHETITRVAGSDASVLVRGETGVGKELVARRIHDCSRRSAGPFIAINCAAVPATLLESELFGHARGAFTDAKADRTGLFVRANNGTLFLDEIGELPLELQPKLLRALQERCVRPVGTNAEVPFDARLIAASNRDLEMEVEQKRFREDLYYRINVVQIDLPPLRKRDGDVLELAQYFLQQHAGRSDRPMPTLSPEVAEKLMAYQWPGNVRELENCIARAVAFARYEQLTVDDLPEKVRSYRVDRFVVTATDTMEVVALTELERRYVQRVLALFGGNKSHAAEVLGIDRRTLYRKIEKWGEEAAAASNGASGSHAST